MNITIFGTGYVGLVTGACLADIGHQVLCVDVNKEKIESLKQGVVPIFEPGLESLVEENSSGGLLQFTSSIEDGVAFASVIFIAVGTPPQEDGSADLSYVLSVAKSVGELMAEDKIVVSKSTVPVGTCDKVKNMLSHCLQERQVDFSFDVVSNPEFLKEGAAINDFMKPDRIVIGCSSDSTREVMRELYGPFNRNHDRMVCMSPRSAELTKYAANALLATKISFINEVSNIAERVGADIEDVRRGIGSDPRIGYQFIYPGCGYGGSCFPKDVKALARMAGEVGCQASILDAVDLVNENQKRQLPAKVRQHYGADLSGKVFALWGLAFKPQTDDMREASSLVLMEELWAAGARVQAFDPESMEAAQAIVGSRADLSLMGTKEAALAGADALIICTEWKAFQAPDFDVIAAALKDKVIFDGRNLFEPEKLKDLGFNYYAIGRGDSVRIVETS